MPEVKATARKKLPKELAVIDADHCTGCDACIEVCPVDCIVKIDHCAIAPGWCEIDWDRCIGCKLCIRIPTKKSDPYELKICPWDAIEMASVEELVEAVARSIGPPSVAEENRRRLTAMAQRQVDLAAGK